MSGGSYNYIWYKLENECCGRMYDIEMDELIEDLCGVLHALEWWQSGDSSKVEYQETVANFKKKWLNGDRETRLKGYIDQQIGMLKETLYNLIESEATDEKDNIN